MKLRFFLLASAAASASVVTAAAPHDDGKKYDLLRSAAGRKLGEMDGGEAETLPEEGVPDNTLPGVPDNELPGVPDNELPEVGIPDNELPGVPCEDFKEDCEACAAAGYCVFSPDVGKDGSCLPNCDMAPADGACYSPPNFDDMTCKELSTDCEKDFDTCMGCLGSGFCAYSPDTGKDGSCLASCDDADGDARCFDKGTGDDMCAKMDTEEPTESPTDAPTIFVEPTFSPTPEPTTALPTSFPTVAITPEPSDPIPVSEPTPLPTIMVVEPTPLPSPEPTHVAELTCTNTGGKIGKADCCLFVSDFVSVSMLHSSVDRGGSIPIQLCVCSLTYHHMHDLNMLTFICCCSASLIFPSIPSSLFLAQHLHPPPVRV